MSTQITSPRKLGHPDTSTVFVGGLLGLIGILPAGLLAWYFGNRLLAKYDAEPDRWGARGWAESGIIMAKIGIAVFAVQVVFGVLLAL